MGVAHTGDRRQATIRSVCDLRNTTAVVVMDPRWRRTTAVVVMKPRRRSHAAVVVMDPLWRSPSHPAVVVMDPRWRSHALVEGMRHSQS